jgi:hypothetical protein
MPNGNDNVDRLATAGLIEKSALDGADREIIQKLSTQEVDLIIKLAREQYPDDSSMVKLGSLRTGKMRILIPL